MSSRLSRFIKALVTGDTTNIPPAKTDVEKALLEGINNGFGKGNDNILFINLTFHEDSNPERYSCDMKEVDVWNAMYSGKIVYAYDSGTRNIFKAEDAGDEVVWFTKYNIRANELYMVYFTKDYDNHMPGDADGYSWMKTNKSYTLTTKLI